jgi:mono/diheme cytochrome c family protein
MNGKVAVVCGLWLGVAACNGAQEPPPSDPLEEVFHRQSQEEGLSRDQTEGKRLFVHYCITCHGEVGRGDGQNAYNLDPRPPDFSESLREHTPTYWRDIIQGGTAAVGRSPLCPPWGRNLTDQEMDALVSYLSVLAQSSSSEPGDTGAASALPEKP